MAQLYDHVKSGGLAGVYETWPKATPEAWKTIAAFGAFEAFLQLFMPGKRFEGPVSPKGNVPIYKASGTSKEAVEVLHMTACISHRGLKSCHGFLQANGVQSYAATLVVFFLGWR